MPSQNVPVSLPVGSYRTADPRSSSRRLVNCMAELAPFATSQETSEADSKQKLPPITLRRTPGISAFANDGSANPARGVRIMAGVTYAVIGQTLYSVSVIGALTMLGSGIPGTSFVRMTDNTACLVILVPGTLIAFTYCPNGGGFSQLTNPGFTQYGAIDCGFCDSYIVFLALNGREFFNDDGQIVSGQGQITFTTAAVFPREFGTDLFVGMIVDHRVVYMIGALTTEGYLDVGTSPGTPFASVPDTFMQIGCAAGYSIAQQDQSVFWLANDRTVRRMNGQTPIRVSNHGIEAILADADLTGCYGLAYTLGGHPIYVLTLPAIERTLCYDCTTMEWFEQSSFIAGSWSYWRPLCLYNAFGKFLAGDSQGSGIGTLDVGTFQEFGQPLSARWMTQSVYDNNNRIVHRRVEVVIGGGYASAGTNENLTLKVSDDGGITFRSLTTKQFGQRGQYKDRCVWWNCGQSRRRVYEVEFADPYPMFSIDMHAVLEACAF